MHNTRKPRLIHDSARCKSSKLCKMSFTTSRALIDRNVRHKRKEAHKEHQTSPAGWHKRGESRRKLIAERKLGKGSSEQGARLLR